LDSFEGCKNPEKFDQKWQKILHNFIMQKGLGLEDESMVILNAWG